MANELLQCSVVTPEKKVVYTKALDVVMPAHDGLLGVLPGHAPLLCNLGTGILRYLDSENKKQALFIDGGFGHIHNNEVAILTREAVAPGEISLSQAEELLTQARALSKSSHEETATRSRAISRAKNLIDLAQGS